MQVFNNLKTIVSSNNVNVEKYIDNSSFKETTKNILSNKENNKNDILKTKDNFLINKQNDNTKEELDNLISKMENEIFLNNKLKFNVDNDTNIYIVKVLNQETEELIAQYPAEVFIKNFKYYKDNENLLLDLKI